MPPPTTSTTRAMIAAIIWNRRFLVLFAIGLAPPAPPKAETVAFSRSMEEVLFSLKSGLAGIAAAEPGIAEGIAGLIGISNGFGETELELVDGIELTAFIIIP